MAVPSWTRCMFVLQGQGGDWVKMKHWLLLALIISFENLLRSMILRLLSAGGFDQTNTFGIAIL